jgi:cyclopropane fatty-acyl-phospholipid synthase-like methyltransferase
MLLLDSVRNLLGRRAPHPLAMPRVVAEPPPMLVPATALAEDDDPEWPSARISVAEALWGEGFLFPGGREEALRLAKPLGLSDASSLMLVGAGTGGAPRAITAELGVWVTGYESNPRLTALANERNLRAGLGRRAQVEPWDPFAPQFPPHYYHHAIAIEPLQGAPPELMLAAVAAALKPGAQFVLLETVADRTLDPSDATVTHWAKLDHRPADVPSELGITRTLRQLGFDVRIVEDASQRHMQQAIAGWCHAVQAIKGARPTLPQLALIVHEAELWLARLRLMRERRLRLVRWHAIGR